MNEINIAKNSTLKKTVQVNNDQYSVIRGHVENDLNAEELDLYRFMLGGLLSK